MLGRGLVHPWVYFNPIAQAISKNPAIVRANQFILITPFLFLQDLMNFYSSVPYKLSSIKKFSMNFEVEKMKISFIIAPKFLNKRNR